MKKEYVFGTYLKSSQARDRDAIFVKELIHEDGGLITPRLTPYYDYQYQGYVEKEQYRTYNDKREFAELDRLTAITANRATMHQKVFKALTGRTVKNDYNLERMVNDNPYVYGLKIDPTVLLKNAYKEQYGELLTPSVVAKLDFEWDVNNPEGNILCGSIVIGNYLHIALNEDWVNGEFTEEDVLSATRKYLSVVPLKIHGKDENIKFKFHKLGDACITLPDERAIAVKVSFHKKTSEIVKTLIDDAHLFKPDFVVTWSIKADMEKMLEALKRDRVRPESIFCDPSVPEEFRYFEWKEAPKTRTKSNGEQLSFSPADLYHRVICPATFQFICAMATYRYHRSFEQQLSSLSLDNTLHNEIGSGKLTGTVDLGDDISTLDWHKIMQSKHKLEYTAYLNFDVLSMELLDEHTGDISKALRGSLGVSEFANLKSNPSRLMDSYYFKLKANNRIIGTPGPTMVTAFDEKLPSLNGWIITLPPELEFEMGLKGIIVDQPLLETGITVHNRDNDVTSAYPSTGEVLGIAKHTRKFETCKIPGVTHDQQRSIGLHLTTMRPNAISLAKLCYGLPDPDNVLEAFLEHNKNSA